MAKMHRIARQITAITALPLAALALISAANGGSTPDHPEMGKQGETAMGEAIVQAVPFSKGVNVIGQNTIAKRGDNLIMAWSGACAYVAHMPLNFHGPAKPKTLGPTSGVAVIDASNPAKPVVSTYLQGKGALDAGETLHAVSTKARSVLAASTYGGVAGVNGPKEGWLNVYDAKDCQHPKLMAEVKWPDPVHTITVAPDGKRIYGTIISPFTGNGGIAVMDISDMAKPRFIGKFPVTRPPVTGDVSSSYEFAPHELSISPDERRLYVGVIASKGGDLNPGVKIMPPNKDGLGPHAGGIYILDNSDLVTGKADPKMRLIGTSLHGGWHSVVQANIGGVPHLVGAGELGACPGAWPKVTNLADEKNPKIVGEFRLAMNRAENCPEPTKMEQASGGVIGRDEAPASHFNDVDSATNTRLGLFSFMAAGLRIVDLRTPANPVEIAYFKPGDACMSHVRYVPQTGHIWFACVESGFHIIALKPALRKALNLPLIPRGRKG
ncbi:MAG: hypothetical protein RLY97_662 [Pseudomonadota bacterium]